MKNNQKILLYPLLVLLILFLSSPVFAEKEDFQTWLDGLRKEALEKGISGATLDVALKGIKPIERVIELDRHQPEFKLNFETYMGKVVSDWRIQQGRKLLKEHAGLLKKVGDKYGVPPRFLVAFWGIETNFGRHLGSFQVINSLATLAYDPRRSGFFRKELLHALKIIDEGHISSADMKGSWAGAMGQLQFMPSTFTGYATDADGDGRKDIWHTMPDIMYSAANFLSRSGWRRGYTWGREVQLPQGFDRKQAGLKIKKSIAYWHSTGVRNMDGSDLPVEDMSASIILPSDKDIPAFLVYDNYRVIMRWNRSHFYAVAVGHLADRIIGKGPLLSQ